MTSHQSPISFSLRHLPPILAALLAANAEPGACSPAQKESGEAELTRRMARWAQKSGQGDWLWE